jgi:glycerol uptake facilitator-like aquaporin
LGFWSVGRFPAREVVPYVTAQCTGAVAASLVLRSALGPVGELGATLPRIPLAPALAVEWLLSFALMFVIMAVATDERVADGFAALAVGLTVGFCALMAGPITGASMNPARSFGPALIGDLWQAHWIYWLAPITGMMTAAQAYGFLRLAEAPHFAQDNSVLGVQGRLSPLKRDRRQANSQ